MDTIRLTVGQALVRFLTRQYTERDGVRHRAFAGCFGIFGHGNVAGVGQALLEAELGELADPGRRTPSAGVEGDAEGEAPFRYYQARNEQGMVHAAAAYARMTNRLSMLACTSSIGPGATNMVTGAALATINRLPVLLLPGDVFATRAPSPVLQELESGWTYGSTVNDCLRPVSRFWDRVDRPEQLAPAMMQAMRVLTDPAENGAVTLALPQDVQAEGYDWPVRLFDERVWRVRRPVPEPDLLAEAARQLERARRPLIVAGGGVIYSEATEALVDFVDATGVPVAETQAGKGSLPHGHPCLVGAVGATGTAAANALAREADLVLGIGTRYTDFTTASHTAFENPDVRFVNLNVASVDTSKHAAAVPLLADARSGLAALRQAVASWSVDEDHRADARARAAAWDEVVERAYRLGHGPQPAQSEVLGAVNDAAGDRDVVVCAAGSMPGDLHKLWRTADPKQYHVEYGYSCMGYEIAGGLGVKMAAPDREVFVLVGDGSYLMLAQELVTAVQEGRKLIVVLVDNQGFQSIGGLSETVGAQGFGTRYRYRSAETGRLDGDFLPVDLAANAASLGADVTRVSDVGALRDALAGAKRSDRTTVIYIATDPTVPAPDGEAWWDVPVAEVSALDSTRRARAAYEKNKDAQRPYL